MKFTVIGIDDNQEQHFQQDVLAIIANTSVFSGGKRHYEIVKKYLPSEHAWVEIKVPLLQVFEAYKAYDEIVVFASGDPLFNGFGNTILRECPDAEVKVFPYFNSLQLLAHRMLLPYQDMHTVTLTGRPWAKFDEALIKGCGLIGVLTDRKLHTPQTIAERMLTYGFDNYMMTVGELLGNNEREKYTTLSLEDVGKHTFQFPNNIILQKTHSLPRPFGIPKTDFHLLNGRAKMITKMPIRLLSLHLLDLRNRSVFWDVGFCTGSVSIEAKMQFPHLQIFSFEIREEGTALMRDNSRKFHTPGIESFIGDFLAQDVEELPRPEAVFIGGYGGKLKEFMIKINNYLLPNGVIVFNSVSEKSLETFKSSVQELGMELAENIRIRIDDFNEITALKAIKTR
ncbi:precorrin-6Y C5,15-methyltransferase (decarboxylating) [Balneicella halophila]|uniref:Precorrin-6Y C5,15-methyltransferase (Decarboxylating) n=1 Tax=Balneicella halophila TaxID=1537566 RepID=A0A7L4USF8_BALHA|nr:precorrin-6y C5,15-methyltransferase (decarboxylating) subunit CbiE [Balneicella halophila]PVX52157.1 precorrin-6Y C5,15-methyltransferase (decarboxylating) [Balneicella halophila]